MVCKYVEVMRPKLAGIKDTVVQRLLDTRADMVTQTRGKQVGTKAPTDFFSLMSEHLVLARKAGSFALQQRLLSQVMTLVVDYARTVLSDLMDWWRKDMNGVDIDYVSAVINDSGECTELELLPVCMRSRTRAASTMRPPHAVPLHAPSPHRPHARSLRAAGV